MEAVINADGARDVVGQAYAYKYLVVPLDLRGDELIVAAHKRDTIKDLEVAVRKKIVVETILPADVIRSQLRTMYDSRSTEFAVVANEARVENTREMLADIFENAFVAHASDVHIEPTDTGGRVRHRVDGLLHTVKALSKADYDSLVSIVKHDANLPLDKMREFQGASIPIVTTSRRRLEARLSVAPSVIGQSLVMRVAGSASTLRAFEDLGMPPGLREMYEAVLRNPQGVHLVVGGMGQGKSTTVFSVLSRVDDSQKVVSIEDPVELRLPGMVQTEVSDNVSFASAMREFMREDADVIFNGEIRDDETALEAMRAGLAGVVVFTTLHASDCIRAFDRLIEFNVRRGTIGSALRSVLAQRILRKLCMNCREAVPVPHSLRILFPEQFQDVRSMFTRSEAGCEKCGRTGVVGRTPIFELLVMNGELEDAIVSGASRAALATIALRTGYVPMREHAAALIAEGVVSMEDAMRAVSLAGNGS